MDTATYHTEGGQSERVLHVLSLNDDGTVDLGNENGDLVVGKCKISEAPIVGQCVLIGSEKSDGDDDSKLTVKELREKAETLGIDCEGLKKKQDFIEAIEAKQTV